MNVNVMCKPRYKNGIHSAIASDIVEHRTSGDIDYTLNQVVLSNILTKAVGLMAHVIPLPLCMVVRLLVEVTASDNIQYRLFISIILSSIVIISIHTIAATFVMLRTCITTHNKSIIVTDIRVLGILLMRRTKCVQHVIDGNIEDIPDGLKTIMDTSNARR